MGGMGFLKLISQAFPCPHPQSPLVFFPALSLALFFARVPLSERLEQAIQSQETLKNDNTRVQTEYANFKLLVRGTFQDKSFSALWQVIFTKDPYKEDFKACKLRYTFLFSHLVIMILNYVSCHIVLL